MNQLTLLCKLTGNQRLEQSFALSDFTLELARKNVRENLNKRTSRIEILKKLKQRLKKT